MKMAVLRSYTVEEVPKWICENTKIKGAPYSYVDHEFQEIILRDPSPEKNVRKCSQIGLSELSARGALGMVNVLHNFTVIYTLPTASFAKTFSKTRIDPVIQESEVLKANLNPNLDNADVKQFNQSFLYIKGTKGQAAAISVPADLLIHDEVDFSDPEVMSNYTSRLTHSKFKMRWRFSTPTAETIGISEEFKESRRFWNMVKCHHCNHWFLPSYFEHLHIPGFTGDIREINRQNKSILTRINYQQAKLFCPECGKEPSLQKEHRQYVCENPTENFVAAGYQIQPFDAPNVIAFPDLIMASTGYKSYSDFINFNLGLPANNRDQNFDREDFSTCIVPGAAPSFATTVAGIDMGLICTMRIAGVDYDGRIIEVHKERIPISNFEKRLAELTVQFRINLMVMDSQPYGETLLRLQKSYQNLYGAVFDHHGKDMEVYKVKRQEADPEKGKAEVRQVNVKRDKALNMVFEMVRGGGFIHFQDAETDTAIEQCLDMKCIRQLDAENDELVTSWVKSKKGNDHYHFALLYLYLAAEMRGMGGVSIALPYIMATFKNKNL